MRYTPIIDISEFRELYKNLNIRLVYLHMVLKSGYHDYDKDILNVSIRGLAEDVGLNVGAVRHALEMLTKAKLIVKRDGLYYVRKYIKEQKITPRAYTEQREKAQEQAQEQAKKREEREQEYKRQDERRNALREQGKTEYMLYYESMMKKAEEGDLDAAKIVARNRDVYLAHKRKIEQEQQTK